MISCAFGFGHWEKNWMPFEDDGKLLALRWFAPHTVVEIDPDSGRCTQAHQTHHAFGSGAELHGGAPPVRYESGGGGGGGLFLALVRLRVGGWVSSSFELRDYANLLYVFDASPPYAVRRVSAPFTLPSCVQQKLHMRIQVVKSLVRADGGYLLCWGELDCYSCCATLPDALVRQMLQMPSSGGG